MPTYNYQITDSLVAPLFSNGESSILLLLQLTPILGSFLLLLVPGWKIGLIRMGALLVSLATFLMSLVLWILFDPLTADFQFRFSTSNPSVLESTNTEIGGIIGDLFNLSFSFGIDGISLWLVLLTTFLTPICILVG